MKNTPCKSCVHLGFKAGKYWCWSIGVPLEEGIAEGTAVAGLPDCPFYQFSNISEKDRISPLGSGNLVASKPKRKRKPSVRNPNYSTPEELEKKIIHAILDFEEREGELPTAKQINDILDLTTLNYMRKVLGRMENAGRIKRTERASTKLRRGPIYEYVFKVVRRSSATYNKGT